MPSKHFLILGLCLLAVLALSYLIIAGSTYDVDTYLLRMYRDAGPEYKPIGSAKLQSVIRDITSLGSGTVLTALTACVLVYHLLRKEWKTGLFIAVSILLGWFTMEGLKLIYHRERPTVVTHMMEEESLSLPSGHAMMSTVVFFTLAGVYGSRSTSKKVTYFAFTLAGVLAFMIGYTRIYLGVHHPSDVLAGWLLGLSWALGALMLYRKLNHSSNSLPASGW